MITLNSEIDIKNCPDEKYLDLVDYLTISNPKYTNALSLNLSLFGIDPTLKYYTYNRYTKNLKVPIGVLNKVKDLFGNVPITDLRTSSSKFKFPDITFTGKLRDYQKDVLNSLKNNDSGVVSAMTGSGKTVIMIAHILQSKRPTLVLVHTNELAHQFITRLKQFTDITEDNIGFYGNNIKRFKPITVCLLQTLVRSDKQILDYINQNYSQVICDETHIIAADTYYTASKNLTAKYKYGFSATPEREDGLTKVIYFASGDLIHDVPKSKLIDSLIMPEYKIITTDYFFPLFNTNEYQSMISDLSLDKPRNDLVLDIVNNNKDKLTVILCDRALQVLYLKDKIPGAEFLLSRIPEHHNYKLLYKNNKIISKTMAKKDRQSVMNRLYSGESKIVISTYGLMSTGIDLPDLEVLILASPIKSKIKIKQSIGRIMRKGSFEKTPVIYDLHDTKVELLKYQASQRQRVIKSVINT